MRRRAFRRCKDDGDGAGVVAGRGVTFPPAAPKRAGRKHNKKATAADTRCGTTGNGGGSAPAAGLEPATRRLTAVCSTN